MEKFNNIFLKINYKQETVTVNLNNWFISNLYHYYVTHLPDASVPYSNWNIEPLWSFDFLINALKSYCSPTDLKKFLKEYSDFLEYFML
jgi:hypothetical protein